MNMRIFERLAAIVLCFVYVGLATARTNELPSARRKNIDDRIINSNVPAADTGIDGVSGRALHASVPNDESLSKELLTLRVNLHRCLSYYGRRPSRASRLCAWEVMHRVIGFGVDAELYSGSKRYNAVAWLCENLPCQGMRMMDSHDGQLAVRIGEGFQGHAGQFLAVLAQSRINIDYPLIVDGRRHQVADLVRYEKAKCRRETELSFQLIGLSHYLDTDAKWRSDIRKKWDLAKMIKEELAQSVVDSSCGGTHRMMSFSYAVRKRQSSGKPMTGQWYRAKVYIEDYHNHTFNLQNRDGSFSTAWFRVRQDTGDIDRKLTTTGHILEWLIFSLDDEDLTDPRILKAVSFLTELLWTHRNRTWEIGPLGHAIHALSLYDQRVFAGSTRRWASKHDMRQSNGA